MGDRNIIIKKFNSASAYLEWATNAPCLWKSEPESREEGNKSWAGTASYDEAYKLAKYGWRDGIKKLSREFEIAKKILPPVTRERKRYDLEGFVPNPGRAASGEMFSMLQPNNKIKHKPVINIRNNFSYTWDKSSDEIIRWGASVCSYIDALEQSGVSVQLEAAFESRPSCGGGGGPALSFQFPLKRADQQLSIASLVFWWAHPSALRRIGFSAKERLDVEQYYRGGYGRPKNVTTSKIPNTLHLDFLGERGSIEENIKSIREKHMDLIKGQPKLAATVPEFNFK